MKEVLQAPGDANYNPHHAVDAVTQLEVPLKDELFEYFDCFFK